MLKNKGTVSLFGEAYTLYENTELIEQEQRERDTLFSLWHSAAFHARLEQLREEGSEVYVNVIAPLRALLDCAIDDCLQEALAREIERQERGA